MRYLKTSALRAFEAAARRLSFKLAAEELYVTPTAISHQIKALEQEVDCRLFERRARQVKLTVEGQELFTTVKKAFDDIDETASQIKSRSARDVVTLGLGPIIGTRWLAPRLGDFWARHRDIDLRLHHTTLPMHRSSEQFDLAIAWGDGHWPGMDVVPFIQIQVTPVMAPQLAAPQDESALLDYTLIHERDRRGWQQWFTAAGIAAGNQNIGTVIDDANLVLQTVLDGQGIALGILPFVEEDLRSGRLLRPFALAIDPGQAYYLINRRQNASKSAVRKVRKWLLGEIASNA